MYNQDEEIEEDFQVPPLSELQFNLNPSENFKSKVLIIGLYGVPSLFLSSFVDSDKPIATINFEKAKQKSLASVYANKEKDRVYLLFNDEIDKMKEVHFQKFITKHFKYETAFILTSTPRGMLQNSVAGNLLYIKTSNATNQMGLKFEEGWSGIQADLLAYGEIMKIPMTCYIGVTDEYQMEKEGIKQIFGSLEGKWGFEEAKFDNSNAIKKYNMRKNAKKMYL